MSKWNGTVKVFVTALVMSFFAGSLIAADANKPMAKPHERPHAKQDMSQVQLKHLTATLGLTEKQQQEVKPILEEQTKQMQELHKDQSIPQEQKRAKMMEIRKATDAKIEQVLTPEQKEKFLKMREEQKAKIESRRATRNAKLAPDSNSKK